MDFYRFMAAKAALEQRALAKSTAETAVSVACAVPVQATEGAEACHALARSHLQQGNRDAAAAAWQQALSFPINDLVLLDAIAQGLRDLGRDPLARMDMAQGVSPLNQTTAWQAVCLSVLRQDWTAVLPALQDACDSHPACIRRANNLAYALRQLGRDAQANCIIGSAQLESGNYGLAAEAFAAATPEAVQVPEFLSRAILALRYTNGEAKALQLARSSAELGRCNEAARIQWANTLTDLHRVEEARAVLRAAAEETGQWKLRLQSELILPQVAASIEEIARADAHACSYIRQLEQMALPAGEDTLTDLYTSLEPNFYLGYRSEPNIDPIRCFGRFVSRVAAARFPQYGFPPQRRDTDGRRLRIGYASCYLVNHTITRHFAGWFEHANRHEFEIHMFPFAAELDPMSAYLGAYADHVHPTTYGLEAIAETIRAADLDLLVHLSIGMDPLSMQLGALHLAPVQCVSWGHPVSTGLTAIDYFISVDSMEPADGNMHYSERLVTLPGVGVAIAETHPSEKTMARIDFGLPERVPVFLSLQSLFKYLPQHDGLYARIARELPDAVFVFVEGDMPAWTRTFRNRMEASFEAACLPPEKYIRILPRMAFSAYQSLLCCCDVALDTMDFSGGQTSYDLLSNDLPIVTLPGRMMRGRQTYGMLKQIGVEDTIATDADDYVRIAVRLGQERAVRDDISRRIRKNKHLLFNDPRPVQALEAFYRWATGNALPSDQAKFRLWPPV